MLYLHYQSKFSEGNRYHSKYFEWEEILYRYLDINNIAPMSERAAKTVSPEWVLENWKHRLT